MLESQSRASKDSSYSLEFKTLSHNIGSLDQLMMSSK